MTSVSIEQIELGKRTSPAEIELDAGPQAAEDDVAVSRAELENAALKVQPGIDELEVVAAISDGLHSAPHALPLDPKAFLSLLGQHFSNSWSARSLEFAVPLSLIHLFPNSLLPASVYGFAVTGSAIVLSRFMGRLVDQVPKLPVVRGAIAAQKLCASILYAALLADLIANLSPRTDAAHGVLVVVVLAGCLHQLATICIQVSIERDWAVVIADGSSENLTRVNVWLRRIDLLCKLLSPLVVSLLTLVSYTFAVAFLAVFDIVGMVFELFWTQVVYRRIPALDRDQERKNALHRQQREERSVRRAQNPLPRRRQFALSTKHMLRQYGREWNDFVHLPIFLSSLAISALYMTVLSFDGVMLSYFISHGWSQAFLAGIRALMVAAGLAGTLVMPLLERLFGLVRAGSWSIWSEVLCLIPVVVGFLAVVPPEGVKGPVWASALIFVGMILSRVGLWSLDLCQSKSLQLALDHHPDRNSITALQISMQNVADLAKYLLTIILARPSQFRWAALASFVSVNIGAVLWSCYARQERGHLLHLDRLSLISLISRKET